MSYLSLSLELDMLSLLADRRIDGLKLLENYSLPLLVLVSRIVSLCHLFSMSLFASGFLCCFPFFVVVVVVGLDTAN